MTGQPPNILESSHGALYTEEKSRNNGAEDYLSDSLSKRCHISSIPLVRLWCHPPHPLSINGLIRKHCRNRLYVHPLQWTAQHLELLGYRFVCQDDVELRRSSHHRNLLPLPSKESIYKIIDCLRSALPPVLPLSTAGYRRTT